MPGANIWTLRMGLRFGIGQSLDETGGEFLRGSDLSDRRRLKCRPHVLRHVTG